jgi:hypothetical protein
MYLYAYIMGIKDLAVTVDIPGVGVVNAENAAQDSTLNAILGAIQTQSKGGGGGSAKGGGFEAANQKAKSAASGLGVLSGAVANTSRSVDDASETAADAGSKFKAAGKSVFSSFSTLATQSSSTGGMLKGVGDTIGKVGGVIGGAFSKLGPAGKLLGGGIAIAAGALGLLSGVLSRNIEQFEKVSSSGASFGNSLMKFRLISNEAGLSTEMLANVVQKAGEQLAAFGGTTERGGQQFAKNNKMVQNEYGEIMLRMGVGFTEQGSLLAEFMGNLAAGGEDLSSMPTEELTKSFMTLTTQQKMMAQYNGTSLEQERQKIKAMREDAALQAALLDLSPKQREAALTAINSAENMVAGSGKALKELFLTNGSDFFTAGSAALMGELGPAASDALRRVYTDIKAGNLEGVENLKGFANSFGPEQLKNMAEIAKAGAMGASGAIVDAISGAFVTTQKTIGKEINETFTKIQQDFATLKIPAVHELDNSAAKLATTVKNLNTVTDKLVTGALGSSEFKAVLDMANAGIEKLTQGIELIPTKPGTPSVSIIDTTVKAIGDALVNYFKGESLSLGTNGFQDFGSGTPAILHGREAVIPEGNASQLVKDLLAMAKPDVAIAQGLGANVPSSSVQSANANSGARLTIPADVADAIKNTPIMLSKLADTVKRSSEENANTVSKAIAFG